MSSNFILTQAIRKALVGQFGGTFDSTPRSYVELTNNNQTATVNSYAIGATSRNAMLMGQQYYFEMTLEYRAGTAAPCFGIVGVNDSPGLNADTAFYFYSSLSAIRRGLNATVAQADGQFNVGDVLGVHVDLRETSVSSATFYRNGVLMARNVRIPTGNYYALACAGNVNHTARVTANFGDLPFRYPIDI